MFGKRDPLHYGTITLDEIDAGLQALAGTLGVELEAFQTNSEGEMCERIHRALMEKVDAVLINAGAWTHYSYGSSPPLDTGNRTSRFGHFGKLGIVSRTKAIALARDIGQQKKQVTGRSSVFQKCSRLLRSLLRNDAPPFQRARSARTGQTKRSCASLPLRAAATPYRRWRTHDEANSGTGSV